MDPEAPLKEYQTMNEQLDPYLHNKDAADPIVEDLSYLRCHSVPTSRQELDKINFINRVKQSLVWKAWTRGYGLAGIQISLPIRAAWYRIRYQQYNICRLLWNPEILDAKQVLYFPHEGCLSLPRQRMTTKRFQKITVKNGDGEIISVSGLEAVVIQHEIDHMNGVLCIDHAVAKEDMPGRNDACPCGSGKKFKKCCM